MGKVINICHILEANRASPQERLVIKDPVREVPVYQFGNEETFSYPDQTRGSWPFPQSLDD